MVEKLRVRHPEFAQRLQRAAKNRGIAVKHIAQLPGIRYEMARRYWSGMAKPRGPKLIAIAELVGLRPADLEYGPARSIAEEPRSPYATLSEVALDVARAWSKLSPFFQKLYRDCIFRDAAVESVMPWLKVARPTSASYDIFEKSVERDYQQQLKQLKLDI